jgi:Na+/H+-dicarboxylate symporter
MYQKILIGIAVGVVFGVFFGPQSVIFEKNTLYVPDAAKLDLRIRPDGPKITLPAAETVDFQIIGEQKSGAHTWYAVSFELTSRLLVDKEAISIPGAQKLKAGKKIKAYVPKAQSPPPSSKLGLQIMAWVSPIGEIFLRLILMLVVPMVFAFLVVGVASLGNIRSLGKLGLTACIYAAITSVIAILIGGGLALLVRPGDYVDPDSAAVLAEGFKFMTTDAMSIAKTAPDLVEFIVQIVPDNPLHSMTTNPPNILQIMFFAIMFGVALTLIPEKRSAQVVGLIDKVSRVLTMVMHLVLAVSPLGVACLIAQTVGSTGLAVLDALGLYMVVVLGGLALYGLVVIGIIVSRLTSVGVRDFWKAIWPAELIAFGTASSTATLPVSMECAEDTLGVSNRISSFAIPLGSSINMDGTALFQAVAVVFIAQVFDVDLSAAALVTLLVATLLASVGTAAVPSAGLVSLALICSAVGIPPEGIALVVGVDRLLDMFRTPINVATDLAGALVLARLSKEKVSPLSPQEDARTAQRGFEKRLAVKQVAYRGEDEEKTTDKATENGADESAGHGAGQGAGQGADKTTENGADESAGHGAGHGASQGAGQGAGQGADKTTG